MQNLVSEKIKTERLARLQELLNEQQIAFNKSFIGQVVPVLFDGKGKKDNQLLGRSPHMQSVFATGNERLIGEIINVKITTAAPNSISGEIVTEERICA